MQLSGAVGSVLYSEGTNASSSTALGKPTVQKGRSRSEARHEMKARVDTSAGSVAALGA